jgi:hypothetical protein
MKNRALETHCYAPAVDVYRAAFRDSRETVNVLLDVPSQRATSLLPRLDLGQG